ncbi:pyridoxal phosphate-dependent transferase [Podospora fimiseda]|uniref:Pyridoxal phosphate-dependent transferase n=1 Tax=Podospora fimiseda TaxID=252190 RepID=A0AAN7BN88_9PEZI|nr:pyridoxal phosphate-dependent transferase [Podospora fimiseda]
MQYLFGSILICSDAVISERSITHGVCLTDPAESRQPASTSNHHFSTVDSSTPNIHITSTHLALCPTTISKHNPNRTITMSTSSSPSLDPESDYLLKSYTQLRTLLSHKISSPSSSPITPSSPSLSSLSLHKEIPPLPLDQTVTTNHLLHTILPNLNNQSISPNYYAFVTGSVLPIAQFADNIVTALDQNVQVHLPLHSPSTQIEDSALCMLLSLINFDQEEWKGRTFTTGATAGNILGLACGREYIINKRLPEGKTVAELGFLRACKEGGVQDVQVLTSLSHSSLSKAASVVGLGTGNVKQIGQKEKEWRLDLDRLEKELKEGEENGVVSIIAVSAGEVNTGRFATGVFDMPKIRSLADRYGAWVHVDGAFGLFVRALPKTDEFLALHAAVAGLELADSIAADGHKMLNVPYDNGIFLCRNASILTQVCSNPNAAYLSSPSSSTSQILSPLNIGIENSRRFRALPVYAVLLSEGRQGMGSMFSRMALLARRIAALIRDSEHYDWLPSPNASLESTFIIVLFRAKDEALNQILVDRINGSGKMYVSGTMWEGKKAVRLAVSTWRVDVERDIKIVEEVLTAVVAEHFDSAQAQE